MFWPTVSVIGFVVLTTVVIALGRSCTASWERSRLEARTPRPEDSLPATAPPSHGAPR